MKGLRNGNHIIKVFLVGIAITCMLFLGFTETEAEETEPKDIAEFFSDAVKIKVKEQIQSEGPIGFSLDSVYWCREIMPEKPDGSYSFVGEEEGCTYLVLEGMVTNLTQDEIDLGTFSMGGDCYIGTVEYDAHAYFIKMACATEEKDSITTRVTAESTVPLYVWAAIPNSKMSEETDGTLYLGYGDLQENITNTIGGRKVDWDACEYKYKLDFEVKNK